MLSIVAPQPAVLQFPLPGNPAILADCDDPGLLVARLAPARIRLSGIATGSGSRLTLLCDGERVGVPLEVGDTAEGLVEAIQLALPVGYRAYSRRAGNGALDVSIVRLSAEVGALPHVEVELIDPVQRAVADGTNCFEIHGVVTDAGDGPSFVTMRLDGKAFTLRLSRLMTPAQTARLLVSRLPVGYQGSVEASRIPGAPARVVIVRDAGIHAAAA